jgi:RNA polymerase sigma-70 factor (ECF subfamily)
LALEDFALHYVSSRDSAKDIVQETFYRIWEQHERWAPDSVEAYLFGAVRNRSFKMLRRERRARECRGRSIASGISPAMGRAVPDGDEAVRRAEIALAFTLALSKLPKRARAAAKLRWFDGLSRHEIARTLDIAERTVGSHLVRAGRFMRSALSLFES